MAAPAFDLTLDARPPFSVPGRLPGFSWRAPGDVDRASAGAAARLLYAAPPLHEAARLGRLADVAALLDGGAAVDELDGVRRALTLRSVQADAPERRAATRRFISRRASIGRT